MKAEYCCSSLERGEQPRREQPPSVGRAPGVELSLRRLRRRRVPPLARGEEGLAAQLVLEELEEDVDGGSRLLLRRSAELREGSKWRGTRRTSLEDSMQSSSSTALLGAVPPRSASPSASAEREAPPAFTTAFSFLRIGPPQHGFLRP